MRRHGVGRSALAAVVEYAMTHGATEVRADTAGTNFRALRLMENVGFELSPTDADGRVQARLILDPKA